jgi:GNAT superfamily N-acetyltransferase
LIKIRKARREDAQVAFDIRKNSILEKCTGSYSDEQLSIWTGGTASERFMGVVESHFYVATVDNTVAATGMVDTDTGMIDAIFVDPKHMGKGLAKLIIAHLEMLAKSAGLNALKLDSTLNAASFYRMHGFVGNEVSIYESPKGISLACVPMKKIIE